MTYYDLHVHFVPHIDDGARDETEAKLMLQGLSGLGFGHAIATPHMRPGMFDNSRRELEAAFEALRVVLEAECGLPEIALSSEHYFDDVVCQRIVAGEALPYPGGRALLLEFYENSFTPFVAQKLFEFRQRRLLPVIAHPERYRPLWRSPEILERLVDQGCAALLDTAALVGKYGREPQRAAETMLERGLYHAACSDAHRPADITTLERGMQRIKKLYGQDELDFLFHDGPLAILAGNLPD